MPILTNETLDLELHMFEKFANYASGSAEMQQMTTGLFDLLAVIRRLRGTRKMP